MASEAEPDHRLALAPADLAHDGDGDGGDRRRPDVDCRDRGRPEDDARDRGCP